MSDQSQAQPPADVPFLADRGWKGLSREPGERELFLAIVVLLAAVVLMTVVLGLPGLFLSFLLLTAVIMTILIYISVGS